MTPAAAPHAAVIPTDGSSVHRFRVGWDLAFYAALTSATVVFAFSDRVIPRNRVLGYVLLAALLGLYLLAGRPALRIHPSTLTLFLRWVLPMLLLIAALLSIDTAFFLLLWVLFPGLFASAPTVRAGAAGAFGLTVVWIVGVAGWDDPKFGAEGWWTGLLQGAVGLAFSIALGAWITSIVEESRSRAELIAQLDATRAELAAAHREAGVLSERERLAGEIHDTLAQGFTSIAMLVQAAQAALGQDDDAVRRHLTSAERTARENLSEARALVAALQPIALQSASLGDAIRRVADRCREESTLQVATEVIGTPRPLGANEEVALLRAAQEALMNVRKHAAARHVGVQLLYADDATTLTIHDDGAGFDTVAPSTGFGLRGLRARVEQIGGEATVQSAPGTGTTVTVQVHG